MTWAEECREEREVQIEMRKEGKKKRGRKRETGRESKERMRDLTIERER